MLFNYIMVTVYDYTFNQQTRIGDDSCELSQENIQDNAAAQYMLENYRTQCPMTNAIKFATNQPAINYTGSHQVGINGCNIDTNSELLYDPLTKPACKISLFERPFATVPYLGRGKSNVVLESQLQQGELFQNRKSINPSTEVCYDVYSQTPLIPSLDATITNPVNLIEPVAAEGWIRGGVPSRELTRDSDFVNTHTKTQYI